MGRLAWLRNLGAFLGLFLLGGASLMGLMVLPGSALAGPNESPVQFVINPANPDTWVVRYEYGLGGFIISEDGGESWTVICGSAVDDQTRSKHYGLGLASDGTIFSGDLGDGLLAGANLGCDWTTGGAIADNWVSSFAVDANDASLIWATTSYGSTDNGLWRYDGDQATWEAVGSREYGVGIASVHTVKTADGLRIYEAINRPNADGGPTEYFVRYSEDDGINWTANLLDFELPGEVEIVAVDPNEPDRVVLGELFGRDSDNADHLWISEQAGAPGSWTALGDLTRFGGAAFDSQGDLYFSNAKGDGSLFVLKQGQTSPDKIRDGLEARCLGFAPDSDRLLGCIVWGFGDISRATGEYSELLSMKDPVSNLTMRSCAGKNIAGVCKPQMTGAIGDGWCLISHWPESGVCAEYGFPALDEPPAGWVQTSGGTQATGGDAVTGGVQVSGGMLTSGGVQATGGAVGSGGLVAGDAGALDGGVTSGDDPNVTKIGCSCRVVGSGQPDYSTPALVLLALCATGLRRRRRL